MKKIKMCFPASFTLKDLEAWTIRNGKDRVMEIGLKPANDGSGIIANIEWNEER